MKRRKLRIYPIKSVSKQKICPIKLDLELYLKIKNKIIMCQRLMKSEVEKQKAFFVWIFHIIHIPRYSLLKLQAQVKKKQIMRYERRTAPILNLRLYSLYSAIMKDGKATLAKNILSKVIILLTENSKEKSGCSVINQVLRFLEPGVGLLKYRRGRNFYSMPVPLWSSRKRFLAVKFLMQGAKRRQKLYRYSFILALFYEILDMHERKKDCYTFKIFKKYRKDIFKVEVQAWRNKKKRF